MPESFELSGVEVDTQGTTSQQDEEEEEDGGNVPGQFPQRQLFSLIKDDKWEEAFMLISVWATDFQDVTQPEAMPPGNMHPGWNILQYACNIETEDNATNTVKQIFQVIKTYSYTDDQLDEFVNYTDSNGLTALHLAIAKEHDTVVEDLMKHGADVNILEKKKQKDGLQMIYDRLHKIMIGFFDDGLKINKSKRDPSNELCWTLECNFNPITGVATRRDKKNANLIETQLLAKVLCQQQIKRKDILLHPLVQIFLHLKGQRLKFLIWLSVLYYMLWLVFSVIFIGNHIKWLSMMEKQNLKPNSGSMSALTCPQNMSSNDEIPLLYYERVTGFQFKMIFCTMVILWLINLWFGLYELKTTPDLTFYRSKYENMGLWILLVILLVANFIPMIFYGYRISSVWTNYIFKFLNSIALIISLLLIQGRTTKLPVFGIYTEMLVKTFQRFIRAFLAFIPTLVAFMITFQLLLPEQEQFNLTWLLSFPKILSMMVGELEYNDLFPNNTSPCVSHPITTRVVFVMFVVFVVIPLQNLLIGLTVDDVQALWQESVANHLSTRLETMYIVENFIFSKPVLKLLTFFKAHAVINWFLVSPVTFEVVNGELSTKVITNTKELKMTELPEQIQREIKRYEDSKNG